MARDGFVFETRFGHENHGMEKPERDGAGDVARSLEIGKDAHASLQFLKRSGDERGIAAVAANSPKAQAEHSKPDRRARANNPKDELRHRERCSFGVPSVFHGHSRSARDLNGRHGRPPREPRLYRPEQQTGHERRLPAKRPDPRAL